MSGVQVSPPLPIFLLYQVCLASDYDLSMGRINESSNLILGLERIAICFRAIHYDVSEELIILIVSMKDMPFEIE